MSDPVSKGYCALQCAGSPEPATLHPEPCVIRAGTQRDAQALSELAIATYTAAFGHTMQASDLAAHVERHLLPHHFAHILEVDTVLIALGDQRMVGYVQFGPQNAASAPEASIDQELRRLYVDAAWQHRGIGTLLLTHALNHPRMQAAERIFLDVWEHNHGARKLYEQHGFRVVGTQSFQVESGAATSDDLVMVRHRATT